MTSGIEPEQATHIVSSARGVSVPETAEQLDWLKQLSGRITLSETGLESVA